MPQREPVLLIVLIETARLRWFVAALGLDGIAITLLRSEDANLSDYLGQAFDDQLSFLRHRLAGSLQRGADRLWARQMKPLRFVFVADGYFIEAEPELTERLADHLAEWMVNPPVFFCLAERGFDGNSPVQLRSLAGELTPAEADVLHASLPELYTALAVPERWEHVLKPRSS